MNAAAVLLRQHHLRVTPQRLLLVDLAQRIQGHFSAEHIHQQMITVYPSISLVSVYRGLETLREEGLVTKTVLGDVAASYEWVSASRHHHLVCTVCGGRQDMNDHELDDLRQRLYANYHFHAALDHLAIFGHCDACGHVHPGGGNDSTGRTEME